MFGYIYMYPGDVYNVYYVTNLLRAAGVISTRYGMCTMAVWLGKVMPRVLMMVTSRELNSLQASFHSAEPQTNHKAQLQQPCFGGSINSWEGVQHTVHLNEILSAAQDVTRITQIISKCVVKLSNFQRPYYWYSAQLEPAVNDFMRPLDCSIHHILVGPDLQPPAVITCYKRRLLSACVSVQGGKEIISCSSGLQTTGIFCCRW